MMTAFQLSTLVLTMLWLALVLLRFRKSILVLIGGLVVLGSYTLVSLFLGSVKVSDLGLGFSQPWHRTVGFALAFLALMILYSPVADRLAGKLFPRPPTLEAFRAIQQSRRNLILGILSAWLLGGILEELVARGIILQALTRLLAQWMAEPLAAAAAVIVAALGAGTLHLYQGPRAVVIITQLSVLFGILFVVSGYNLLAVIICHGLYDTIAFIRFANQRSRYSLLDQGLLTASRNESERK